MSHNISNGFIVVACVGLLSACLPRFLAPSDTYISDSLEPETTTTAFEFTLQPSNVSAADGDTVSFSVATNQYSTVVKYLWQYATAAEPETFIDIPDTDATGYIFIADLAEDDYSYRCLATYDGRTIVSDSAILSVVETTTKGGETDDSGENDST